MVILLLTLVRVLTTDSHMLQILIKPSEGCTNPPLSLHEIKLLGQTLLLLKSCRNPSQIIFELICLLTNSAMYSTVSYPMSALLGKCKLTLSKSSSSPQFDCSSSCTVLQVAVEMFISCTSLFFLSCGSIVVLWSTRLLPVLLSSSSLYRSVLLIEPVNSLYVGLLLCPPRLRM